MIYQFSMETPKLSHLSSRDYDQIYEPSEDSFLFLDALELDLELLRTLKPSICLEIGSGSGVIITAIAKHLDTPTSYLAIDINPTACEITKLTNLENQVNVDIINMDLASCLKNGSVDLLLFNPPYVPTPSEEVTMPGLSRAWAGGMNGREVVDRLFNDVPKLLSDRGIFYLVVLAENQPNDIENKMGELGFAMTVVKERKIRGEHLFVMRFSRISEEIS